MEKLQTGKWVLLWIVVAECISLGASGALHWLRPAANPYADMTQEQVCPDQAGLQTSMHLALGFRAISMCSGKVEKLNLRDEFKFETQYGYGETGRHTSCRPAAVPDPGRFGCFVRNALSLT